MGFALTSASLVKQEKEGAGLRRKHPITAKSSICRPFVFPRIDEHGPDALVQLRRPVNKYPDFVNYIVQRLRTLCPTMGKVKIAQTLARAGLHLGPTTVGRMLKATPQHSPKSQSTAAIPERVVTAKHNNHVWHVDLTTVPIGGFWCSWFPFALPQRWPFCHWLAIAVDHFSRRIVGFAVFTQEPTSLAVRAFLGRTIAKTGATPRYIICDRGTQFDSNGFKMWCKRHKIRPRFGGIGRHGSIAVVERAILTLKTLVRQLPLVPLRREEVRREIKLIVAWYNEIRPHSTLGGRTPNEVYYNHRPANQLPRFEPRPRWPRALPCARPVTLVKGQPGVTLELDVKFLAGCRHLPIVHLKRAA